VLSYSAIDPNECEFVAIGPDSEINNGERIYVEIDDLPIVVFNIGDDGPLGDGTLDGFEVTCPRHGASFDVRTGKVISLPAIVDIPAYPVRIVGGQIEIGLPKN
jgi:3-phenylpropionate/trans-cinnamate dioxygenase ferredoxin subunit